MPKPDVILLAGGLGTRLRSVVGEIPKPMAPVCGRPFLAYLLDFLAGQGVQRVILSLGYQAQQVTQHFGTAYRGMALCAVIETDPLGTGGAVAAALRQCQSGQALVLNGDTFLRFDLQALLDFAASGAGPVMLARQVPDTTRYGRLQVQDGRLQGFVEKAQAAGAGLINAGGYLLAQSSFAGRSGAFSLEKDYLQTQAVAQGMRVFEVDDYFIDIGIPEDYARAQRDFAEGLPQ